ncbi:GntR family transcriptional regulator [Conyzicola sp.]|uniref:GntR family transcriptional regulator n=1 Tax=Conyzicola sp. TaxID=1969404 RepID=UPI003988F53B
MPIPSQHGLHKRQLLRDDVYESLRDAIVDGTFAPGERLKDPQLEEWLGVSRTPIREALLRLERAGLVVTQPGKATTVAPFDLASTISAQQVAASMHELATQLAVPVITPAQIDAMVTANSSFALALDILDADAALDADHAFHSVFVEASGNQLIADVLEQTTPRLHRVERMRFASFAGRASVAQHDAIVEAARAGDPTRAATLVRDNWLSLRFTAAE